MINRIRKVTQLYAYSSIQMHEAIGRKAGFSGTDHKYLGFLIQRGQMTAGEFASLTGLTTGAVTGLIDRFEKKGLLERQFSSEDRRKVIIVPDIEKIMGILAPLYKDFRHKSEMLTTEFSEEENRVIATYFEKAIEIMIETTNKMTNRRPLAKEKSKAR